MALRERIKDVLTLHSAERKGAVLLVMIMLVQGYFIIQAQDRMPSDLDMSEILARAERWASDRAAADGLANIERRAADPEAPRAHDNSELFTFDPNTIDADGWMRLGLSRKQAKAVVRYREAGGRFHRPEDLGRLRALHPDQVERLRPFVRITNHEASLERRRGYGQGDARRDTARTRDYHERTSRTLAPIELNSCDSADLVALPGIGPAFARGILRYRDRLGGYHDIDQLREVYVIQGREEMLERSIPYLAIDTFAIRTIPLNRCSVEELAAHPYVKWPLAKALIAYRELHGPFHTLDEVRNCKALDPERFRKLAPYFSLE
ncbi:MAG: helix-hairpin-helix domain-containing protein [Flavobacteriales bacterium]|nr:helix-hairpin-helix domain-containing protein [Flavobacteriales bacterium]MCB9194406.1 helix-hairpin-helix domain-containing protein [Flavobacteriales bacterium]